MTDYTHLSMRDRCLIATFLTMKTKISIIAARSGRHRSTIYREIKRNKSDKHYMPGKAHEMAQNRHPGPSNKLLTHAELNKYVLAGLKNGWSPEQISGRMKMDKKEYYVCPESIYRYVYRNKNLGLYKLLPTKKSKRRSRSDRKKYPKSPQMIMRNISLRTKKADLREIIGHWEGDTIRFPKDQNTCVTTLVERKSRYVCLRKNKNKKSKTVIDHISATIKSMPKKIWNSLALDQGKEFMNFRNIERETKCKIYFCDPHSPWQRGSNENMNGRLRRFLPKKFKIDGITQRTLDKIAAQANNTPRKCLGYMTPEEVFKQHWKSYCRTTL
jgi:IS30 family transposase